MNEWMNNVANSDQDSVHYSVESAEGEVHCEESRMKHDGVSETS